MHKVLLIGLLVLFVCSCASQPAQPAPGEQAQPASPQALLPTYTPLPIQPTHTPLPTYTPYPTQKPLATSSNTPLPSATAYPTQTPYPTSTPPPKPGSRQLPVPFASTGIALQKDEGIKLEITIQKMVSGDAAWETIRDANMYNDPPPEGAEYVLLFVSAKIAEGPEGETQSFSEGDWTMVFPSGKVESITSQASVVNPEPQFEGRGFPGATIEGWATLARPKGEEVLLLYGMGYDGTGGVWFALE